MLALVALALMAVAFAPGQTTDTIAPTVSITGPAANATVTGTVIVSAAANDNIGVAGVQFQLDGSSLGAEDVAAPYKFTWNASAVTPGSHTLTALARDAAGNQAVSNAVTVVVAAPPAGLSAHWTLDSASGTVASDSTDNGNQGTLVDGPQWAAGQIGGALRFDGSNDMVRVPDAPTLRGNNFTISLWFNASVLSGGRTLFSKPNGNGYDNSYVLYLENNSLRFHSCCNTPILALGQVTANTWYHASVTKTGNTVRLYLNGAPVGSATSSPTTVNYNAHSLLLGAEDDNNDERGEYFYAGLLDDVRFYQRALAAGEVASLYNSTPVLDTTAPTISLTAPRANAIVSGIVTVTATAADASGVAGVQFQLDGAPLGAEDTTAPYSFAWNTATAANGTHTLTAVARDAAGNSTTAAAVAVTVNNGSPDTTAPSVPAGLTATADSSTQVTLAWSASTDNVGVTGYRVFRNNVQIGTTAARTYTNGGLTASTTYSYRVAAYDAAGNVSGNSNAASVTTSAAPDTTAPSVPTGLTATADSSTQISLAWAASTDNIGVTGYRLFRNGAQIATTTTRSYVDTGVAASTTYSYQVAAYDAAANVSTLSSGVSATTPEPPSTGDGLVGQWRFEEGSGTIAASSALPLPATLANAPLWTTGRVGKGVRFNGTGQHAVVADAPELDVTRLTLSAWVYKRAALPDWGMIVHRAAGNAWQDRLALFYNNSAQDEYGFLLTTTSGQATAWAGSSTADLNQWVHLTGTYDGSMLRLYKNGVLMGSASLGGTIPAESNPLSFAAGTNDGGQSYGERFNGALDEISFYNRALSGAEVSALYTNTPPPPPPAPADKKIMPLGDSITYGTYNDADATLGGYRSGLWDRLQASGPPVDFVGSQRHGIASMDLDHEGHPGWTIDQLKGSVAGWLSTYQPDVVLLHIGTNDVIQRNALSQAPTRLAQLLDAIYTARPAAHVIVASIVGVRVPNRVNASPADIEAFNAAIPALVNERASQGRKISYVDMYGLAALAGSDFAPDGFHPSAAGYAKMAEVWYDALLPVLSGTLPPPDTMAPGVPTGLTATALSSSQIALSWSAASDNVGVTGYRLLRNNVQIATLTGRSYTDTGLSASTTYSYRVAAYDAAGNVSANSAAVPETTPAATDTSAPSVPTGLTTSAVSSTQIALAWTASTDNVGVTGYRVFRNSVQVGTSTTRSYTDMGLAASTSYSYQVAAYDAAGNVSTLSSAASAITPAAPSPGGGLIGQWRFEEGAGGTAASSNSNLPATLANAPAWTTGRVGTGVQFNGSNQYAVVADAPELDVTRLTVSAWVYKRGALPDWTMLVHRAAGPSWQDRWALFYNNSNQDEYAFQVATSNGQATAWAGSSMADLNQWVHLTGTYDGSMVRIYKNGALIGAAPLTGDIPAESNPLSFAAGTNDGGQSYGERFNGALDEISFYNRALSEEEVAALYASTPAPPTASGKKVMPLGDSITYGWYNSAGASIGGYRSGLESRLQANGTAVDFVGSLRHGTAGMDQDHEGHSGWTIDQLKNAVASRLATYQPDVVLLHIGTNDIIQRNALTEAPERLERLLDAIHTARPATHVIVASLVGVRTPNDYDALQADIESFNAAIPAMVTARAAQGRNISYVDMYGLAAVAGNDLSPDGLHPSTAGYNKMAAVWYDALLPVLSGTAPPPPPPPPTNGAALQLLPQNPHYFLFRGQPTVLITSGEHYGAVMNLDFDYVRYLNTLAADRLNLTRIFSGVYREVAGSFNITKNTMNPTPGRYIGPWARSTVPGARDGGNKFDLSRWDSAYFARLRDFVSQASTRGIVVEVSLFCPYYEATMWDLSPLNAVNNVQGIGTARADTLSLQYAPGLAVQDAMVRRIVAELSGFDNVYYEIANEPYWGHTTLEWQRHISAVIADAESTLPQRHLISQNLAISSTPISAPDPNVSLFNFHSLRPPDSVTMNYALGKPIGINETGFDGVNDSHYRIQGWDLFMAGGALYNSLDYSFTADEENGTWGVPSSTPGGGSPALRRQMRVLREFMEGFDLKRTAPDATVLPSPPAGASAQALVEAGRLYAVYLHHGTPVQSYPLYQVNTQPRQTNVALSLPQGTYKADWVDPKTGAISSTTTFTHSGGGRTMTSPTYQEDILLRVTRTQ